MLNYQQINWENMLSMRDQIIGKDIEYTKTEGGRYRGPISLFNLDKDRCVFHLMWQAVMPEPNTWWITVTPKDAPQPAIVAIGKATCPQIYLWENQEITIEGPFYDLLQPYRIHLGVGPQKTLDYGSVRPATF